MVRERKNNLDNKTDKEYIQEELKKIKELEEAGRHREARRRAGALFTWLNWS